MDRSIFNCGPLRFPKAGWSTDRPAFLLTGLIEKLLLVLKGN
jgi:hypothetical protein